MSVDQIMTSAEARILDLGLEHLRQDVGRLATTMQDVSTSLKALPSIQLGQQQIQTEMLRGHGIMQDHEMRIQVVERDMPGLKELRRWVVAGVLAGVGMMGAALIKLVVIDPTRYVVAQSITAQQQTQGATK